MAKAKPNKPAPSRVLALPGGAGAPVAPPDRGPIVYVDEVQREFFPRRTAAWVARHVAPEHKFHVGRDAAWYRDDVVAFYRGFLERADRGDRSDRRSA